MTTRSYLCALTALIEVDDASLKSAVLGCRLSDGLAGFAITDPDTVQGLLATTDEMQPERRMQFYLVNKYFVDVRESLTSMLERDLPGSRCCSLALTPRSRRAIDRPKRWAYC